MLRYIVFTILFSFICVGCTSTAVESSSPAEPLPTPIKVADSFAYPIGNTKGVTAAKDKDAWYNAQDFGENNHLGEDWNKNTGGNSDCGEPVYATANGKVVFAQDAGPGWGNVIIVDHRLPSGEMVQSLYGHLREINKSEGEVTKRDLIGTIGDANGRYPCHLHFEIRTNDCPIWDSAGPGYSSERKGWVEPSNFIDARR